MSSISSSTEVDIIAELDRVLSGVEDPDMRDRVLTWAWAKFASKTPPHGKTALPRKRHTQKSAARPGPSLMKNLDLRPKEKQPFHEFVKQKQPATNPERCTIAVYYLSHELGLTGISVDHIYTCYKEVAWRIPKDLYHTLLLIAHRRGWLDTHNMHAIATTTLGENLVEHDLPRQGKKGA